ncbi:UNKNOWN [Stylonychia lemnae]|uniref:Uncharacterized protein n=1 Tax=Stylonychia lemnae TaxID=5949 RepID=A0A078B8B8_STYLE|nr:UNKNOWN [Stylonychia lemnae]|eukprot:CDW90436.1 UNKNOWN [Stylonychia lemnae]
MQQHRSQVQTATTTPLLRYSRSQIINDFSPNKIKDRIKVPLESRRRIKEMQEQMRLYMKSALSEQTITKNFRKDFINSKSINMLIRDDQMPQLNLNFIKQDSEESLKFKESLLATFQMHDSYEQFEQIQKQQFKKIVPENGYEKFKQQKYQSKYANSLKSTLTQIFSPKTLESTNDKELVKIIKYTENPHEAIKNDIDSIKTSMITEYDQYQKDKNNYLSASRSNSKLLTGLNTGTMHQVIDSYLDKIRGKTLSRCQSSRQNTFGPNIYTYQVGTQLHQGRTTNFNAHEKGRNFMQSRLMKRDSCDKLGQFKGFAKTNHNFDFTKYSERDKQSYLKVLAVQLKEQRQQKMERKMNVMIKMELNPSKQEDTIDLAHQEVVQYEIAKDNEVIEEKKVKKRKRVHSRDNKNNLDLQNAPKISMEEREDVARLIHNSQKITDLQKTLQNTLLHLDEEKMTNTMSQTKEQLTYIKKEKEKFILKLAEKKNQNL